MSNTLGGVNLARISQLTLDCLMTEGIPLQAFTQDFNSAIQDTGESVTTRFATVPTTQDFASSKDPGNAVLTARTVTLDKYRGVSLGFTDTELSFTDVQLVQQFIQPSVSAIVDYMINSVLELVTAANFSNSVTKTAAQYDADCVADIAQVMSTAKIPASPRNAIIKPTYFAGLAKDNSIQNAAAFGSNGAVVNHVVPKVHGINQIEYAGTIPGNSENLEGIVCHPQALIIAARGVKEPPPGTWYGKIQNIKEPKTGLPLQVREYYDGTKLRYEIAVLYGVAKGITTKLYRILSA